MEMTMTTYTVKRYEDYTKELAVFLGNEIPKISKLFDNKFDWKNRDDFRLFRKGIFLVCERDEEIVGIHISFLVKSVFDENTRILQQQLFYCKEGSGRAAYYLFKKFIDIGKQEANHIITMLTSQTNIKPETLRKMGFKELETLYRLEV